MDERRTIDTSVGRLSVRVTGEGAPTLLWHSLFVDDRSWDRLVPLLDRGRQLITVNGPGHGSGDAASGDPGRRYSNDGCAAAAGTLLDELSVHQPVEWVGNAWGGHVGTLAASRTPHLIRSLVMLGSPIAALTRAERARTLLLLALFRVGGPSRVVIDGATKVLLSPRTRDTDPDAVHLVADSFRRADRRRLTNAIVSVSLRRAGLADELRRITQPTLIVTGAAHHGFTPEQATAAAALVRHGEVAVVPDAAYLLPLEAPEATAELINRFWAAHAETASKAADTPKSW